MAGRARREARFVLELVTGETAARARRLGLDPLKALNGNDAYPLLEAAGALLKTGPTRTNVCDVVLALIW